MTPQISACPKMLRIACVSAKTGLGISTIWRLAGQGKFPAPVKLTRACSAWFEHEIDAWLRERGAMRGKLRNADV